MRKIQDSKNKTSLYYNKGTNGYNQWRHSLHLKNRQYKQFPQKKKEEKGNVKEMEKRRIRKKGWKEFVCQKERKRKAKGKEKGRMR